ncbi:MaoC family dehydratase [Natronomonas salsuginis]|uniref:MaoC family dehydratase n=1 Tax=Natronomonas salsuginis TaxID=2217661 RepID=A0A4U5J9Q8_9EURY|nr:MaoC family dehydratase [Natronomonas salsuginis]TKR24896.1 MaoC family dehydratase [Natronomonas salsuginis]
MTNDSYSMPFETWAAASSRVFNTFLEANRAANQAAISMLGSRQATNGKRTTNGTRNDVALGAAEERRIEAGEDLDEWAAHREIDGELSVGDLVRFTKTISQRDIERFAAASGDTNPIHLDDEWAEETRFNGRIAHGILVSGLISAALARFPGSVVYLSQDLEFRAPVRIGDRVTATVEIVEDLGGDQFRIRTSVAKDDDPVIDGEAVVLIDDAPIDDA